MFNGAFIHVLEFCEFLQSPTVTSVWKGFGSDQLNFCWKLKRDGAVIKWNSCLLEKAWNPLTLRIKLL